MVRSIEFAQKRSLWSYRGDDWIVFLKITLIDQRSLPKIRDKYPRPLFPRLS